MTKENRAHRAEPPCAWLNIFEGTCECGVGCTPRPRPVLPKNPPTYEESRAFAEAGAVSFHWRMRSIAELRAAGMHEEADIEERAMRGQDTARGGSAK